MGRSRSRSRRRSRSRSRRRSSRDRYYSHRRAPSRTRNDHRRSPDQHRNRSHVEHTDRHPPKPVAGELPDIGRPIEEGEDISQELNALAAMEEQLSKFLEDEETDEQRAERERSEAERRRKEREQLLAQFHSSGKSSSTLSSSTVSATEPIHMQESNHDRPDSTLISTSSISSTVVIAPVVSAATDRSGGGGGDDDDDMFSISSSTPEPAKAAQVASAADAGSDATQDTWDDSEGYYRFRAGDILDGRYRVLALQGQGVFSTVLRVMDLQQQHASDVTDSTLLTTTTATAAAAAADGVPPPQDGEYVIKVIRSNDIMLKSGLKEVQFLKQLSDSDPMQRCHIVRLYATFIHRGHICLVFEPLYLDLRRVIRKYGGIGLSLDAVRTYSFQMMLALRHLRNCSIIHGDLKPDNILLNWSQTSVKLCDFGSASTTAECEITPYLVSRFYRAPEISQFSFFFPLSPSLLVSPRRRLLIDHHSHFIAVLGLPYSTPIDLWSIGCVLYELYTGKILFSGANNNEMLKHQQEIRGPLPIRMIKRMPQMLKSMHFDPDSNFLSRRHDPITGQQIVQIVRKFVPCNLKSMLEAHAPPKMSVQERVKLDHFADFLSKCLQLDPALRPSPEQMLNHAFLVA